MSDTTSSGSPGVAPVGRIDSFPSPASFPLFIYGTLLFPEVLSAIIGRIPESRATSAIDWRVAALRNRVYPGLVSTPGEIARGRLLAGLSEDEWRLLDSFEDPKYELRKVSLVCGEAGLAYVWVDDAEACSDLWDAQIFVATHLPAYVERCAASYSQSQASP